MSSRRTWFARPLILAFALLAALILPAPAYAASTDPVVSDQLGFSLDLADITVEPQNVQPGDKVHVSIAVEGEPEALVFWFYAEGNTNTPLMVTATDPDGDGIFEGDYDIYEGTPGGRISLQYITVWHNAVNSAPPSLVIVNGDNEDDGYMFYRDLSDLFFVVDNDGSDTTSPTVYPDTLIATPKEATVGDTVTVSIQAYDDFGMSTNPAAGVDVNYVVGDMYSQTLHLTEASSGIFSCTLEVTPELARFEGDWQVSSIEFTDDAGNTDRIYDKRRMSSSGKDCSGGDFSLVNMPEASEVEFTVGFDTAAITTPQDSIQPGTKVRFSVPISSTNGVESATLFYQGGGESGSSFYIPVQLKDAGDGTWTGVVTVPVNGGAGSWHAASVQVVDKSGVSQMFYMRELTQYAEHPSMPGLLFTATEGGAQGPDETAPIIDLAGCSVTPQSTRGSETIRYSVAASDDTALSSVRMSFVRPGETPSSGTSMASRTDDGWVTNQYLYSSQTGTMRVHFIEAIDSSGNKTTIKNSYFYPDDPEAQDLSFLDVEVFNDNDGQGPTFDASTISVTPSSATVGDTVTFSVDITDAQGVRSAWLRIQTGGDSSLIKNIALHREDGDTWSGTYVIGALDPVGVWKPQFAYAYDSYNNVSFLYDSRYYSNEGADLSSADLEVYNSTTDDTTPPVLDVSSIKVTPNKLTSAGNVTYSMRATDDLSGVSSVEIVVGRAGTNAISGQRYRYTLRRVAGSDYFTYATRVPWADTCAPGSVYYVKYVEITDVQGNKAKYENSLHADSAGYERVDLSALDVEILDPEVYTDISTATVSIMGTPFVYSGRVCTPDVDVSVGGEMLRPGADYSVSYGENVNAGSGTVTITGKGQYFGEVTKQFLIAPRPISDATIMPEEIAPVEYEGEPVEPTVALTYGGRALIEGTHYRVRYRDNDAAGEATVTIAGRGNFTGTVTKSFQITVDSVPMFRLYNRWTYEHFYCSDVAERDKLVSVGWTDEGVGWYAPAYGDPVYRLYNKWAPGCDHHYTMDVEEYEYLCSVGWTGEGIGWYSDPAQTVPVYREYNPYEQAHNHNYTPDKAEHDNLVSLGWHDEGIGWYGVEP